MTKHATFILTVSIVLTAVALLTLYSCTNNEKEETLIKNRVNEFAKILESKKDNENKIENLKNYFSPESNQEELAKKTYSKWLSKKEVFLKRKIEKVEVIGDTSYVFIYNSWLMPDSTKMHYITKTQWVKIKNQWYRTQKASEMAKGWQEY